MESPEYILDKTLDIVGSSMNSIDSTFEKIPVYKAGHSVGSKISQWIDSLVDRM